MAGLSWFCHAGCNTESIGYNLNMPYGNINDWLSRPSRLRTSRSAQADHRLRTQTGVPVGREARIDSTVSKHSKTRGSAMACACLHEGRRPGVPRLPRRMWRMWHVWRVHNDPAACIAHRRSGRRQHRPDQPERHDDAHAAPRGRPEEPMVITPGMTVTVEVRTRDRTVFSYITKPITKTLSESLTER